jgi:hypothetical protein
VQADEQANVQPEPVVPQMQHLLVPVIPPVQQVLPPVQPVPTQNQGVQAEPVVANGRLILQPVKKPAKKHIENISMWTDAFINYAKVLITKHLLLAKNLFMYMAIIRGAISDATFDRVYMYDQKFRLELNPTNSWSQIDGTLWLRFIAKGASGLQNSTLSNNGSQRPCYDYNFKKGSFRRNCIYRHKCMKCGAIHPVALCNHF